MSKVNNWTEEKALTVVKDRPPRRRMDYMYFAEMARRGWNTDMVDHWLGEPDAFALNPICTDEAPMKLYRADRVVTAECLPAFQDFRRREYLRMREKLEDYIRWTFEALDRGKHKE